MVVKESTVRIGDVRGVSELTCGLTICERFVRDSKSARTASDLSLGELKDELRKLRLSTSGNKSELIIRLNRVNPSDIWTEKLPEEQEARNTEDMTTNEGNISRIQAQLEKYSHDRRVLEEELNTLRV